MRQFSDLFPLIVPHVPGAPEPLIRAHCALAARQLCSNLRCWSEWLDPVRAQAPGTEYDLEAPLGAHVILVEAVTVNGRDGHLAAWRTYKVDPALAGGDLEQALIWTAWTMEFNASVFSAERANYYRCLQTLLLLSQEEERQPLQYLNAFIRMYGAEAVEAASAALSGEAPFYGLQAVDSDLQAFPAHQSLLKAYEKLQRAKAAFWAK